MESGTQDETKLPDQILKRLEAIGADITKIKELPADLAALDKKIQAVEEQQKQLAEHFKKRSISVPGCNDQKEKFSFFYAQRMVAGFDLPKNDPDAMFTQKVMQEAKKKALETGLLTAGGAVIPNEIVSEIIDVLRPNVAAVQLGAMMTQFFGLPVEIPRLDTAATAYWTAENGAITPSQQAFGMVRLSPHELAALIQMSRRSAAMSSPGLEMIARQDIAKLFARAIDLAVFKGTGADGQPLGIVNTTNVTDFASAWTTTNKIVYKDLVEFMGKVEDADAMGQNMGWAMHPKVKRTIQKLLDSQGRPIFNWDPVVSPNGLTLRPSILGFPFATTTQLVASTTVGELFFGDFSQIIIGQWGAMVLETSTEADTAFANHQLWLKGVMEVDIALRQPKSFVFDDNIDPTL